MRRARIAVDEALEPDVDERIEAVVHHIDLGGRKRLGSGGAVVVWPQLDLAELHRHEVLGPALAETKHVELGRLRDIAAAPFLPRLAHVTRHVRHLAHRLVNGVELALKLPHLGVEIVCESRHRFFLPERPFYTQKNLTLSQKEGAWPARLLPMIPLTITVAKTSRTRPPETQKTPAATGNVMVHAATGACL